MLMVKKIVTIVMLKLMRIKQKANNNKKKFKKVILYTIHQNLTIQIKSIIRKKWMNNSEYMKNIKIANVAMGMYLYVKMTLALTWDLASAMLKINAKAKSAKTK